MAGTTDSRIRDDLSERGSRSESTHQLLSPDGTRHPDPALDRWIEDVDLDEIDRMYHDMTVIRRIDNEATALQRQGHLALWPPLLGQEAAQIGSARALREGDFAFTSYREHGIAYARGVSAVDLCRVWHGSAVSGWDPMAARVAPMQVIIGAQSLQAVGYALGIQADADAAAAGNADTQAHTDPGTDAGTDTHPDTDTAASPTETDIAITYFGDGATSQGTLNEALVFASTWNAPVVFFCQNNQWAISEPVSLQSKTPLVDRARGFGIPGVRVDGNDVLAVLAVTRQAVRRARTGGGPTLIEAITYRMGPHTTADDPTRYRDADEVEHWKSQDPIARLGAYLQDQGITDAGERAAAAADAVAKEMRAGVTALTDPSWESIFAHPYAEPHSAIDAQRAAYARYLDGFEEAQR